MQINQTISTIESQPVEAPKIIEMSEVPQIQNKIWSGFIPRINKIFLILSSIFVFGLDLIILIGSSFSLLGFWIEMLLVFGIFVIFFRLENYSYKNKFAYTKSALDPWILTLVIFRNCIFFLNFIPLIQVLGVYVGITVGVPYLIVYLILISIRSKHAMPYIYPQS